MGLRVGVTVNGDMADADLALWSSGITQNVVFLALLLQRLSEVDLAALVILPDSAAQHPLAERFGLPALRLAEAVESLDLIIELGARGASQDMLRFRDRGGRLVSYMASNVMAMNFEAVACQVPYGEIMSDSGFDAVWITPQHWRMNASYAALTRSPAVEPAPHIWTPLILNQSAAALGRDPFWKKSRAAGPARIGILDPNINVVKTTHLPLLACEAAFRRRPDAIDRVLMFNSAHLKDVPHFAEFCAAMDLGRAGRLFAETRHPVASVLGQHIDLVVTHQWENALNYLYWDVLYCGYPLIHNSPDLADLGYGYGDFDPQDGGLAILNALERHADEAPALRPRVKDFLWTLSIDNPEVQARHSELIAAVMS